MPSDAEPFSVLFVCMGNICRSPAAENMLRKLLREEGLEPRIHCDSAGTIDLHTGQAPDRRMAAAGKKRGLEMSGRARGVSPSDFDRFDLILAMDEENLADLAAMAPNEPARRKVKRFCDYCRRHADREVPDPYYGGAGGFEHVLDLLEDGCQNLLAELKARRAY